MVPDSSKHPKNIFKMCAGVKFKNSDQCSVVHVAISSLKRKTDNTMQHRKRLRKGKSQWIRQEIKSLTFEQGLTFLNMYRRRLERREQGRIKDNGARNTFLVIAALLFISYGIDGRDDDLQQVELPEGGDNDTTVILDFHEILALGGAILSGVILASIMKNRKIVALVIWVFLYWPLVFLFLQLLFRFPHGVTYIAYGSVAVLTIVVFVTKHYVYPWVLKSVLSSDTLDVGSFFGINLVSDWIMTYGGELYCSMLAKRNTCKYEGEKNERGLPHGYGFWFDDNYHGELLSGYWKDGEPVAPFLSRQYGTGDAMRAVRVAYFLARDDDFASSFWIPKNENPSRCGVASVECSIEGNFFKHLPEATELVKPRVVDDQNSGTVEECIRQLVSIESSDHIGNSKYVTISSDDARGVQVLGQLYKPTGKKYAKDPKQVVVDVRVRNDEDKKIRRPSRFMPRGVSREELVLVDESEEFKAVRQKDERYSNVSLEVQHWVPNKTKAALIYFPGFNAHTKHCLQSLGQFVAMSNIDAHVYPILFSWPTGQSLTYRWASWAANSEANGEHFLRLLRGISAAGIRDVHFMTHSMGVQSLLGFFEDNEDGSRSDASKFFALDPDFDGGSNPGEESELMVCNSITLLNADFPLKAFVNHAFLTIRRICSHITVIGDRDDTALYFSQLINGLCDYMGYRQAKVLNADGKRGIKMKDFRYQLRIGRDMDKLCFPKKEGDEDAERKGSSAVDERLLFKNKPPLVLRVSNSMEEDGEDSDWLDVDVIDTTNLDTNIAGMRHGAYTVNPILLKDLEELIVYGQRAANRTSLLYREGNTYSFCHAPSFVAM